MVRICFIEGPPLLAPGDSATVVIELETHTDLIAGAELELIEHNGRVVGLLSVLRLWRGAIAI
jgi:hypothetical protein